MSLVRLLNISKILFVGSIKANAVVNATGVWGRNLLEPHGISLPLVPMRHAYVVSETIQGVRGMPNVRDHDFSLYFRVQGRFSCRSNKVLIIFYSRTSYFNGWL